MNETEFPRLARLLQVSDSAFPTGGYAHSQGFEQVVQFGVVHDAKSMGDYLEHHLWPMLIRFELPVVRLAQDAAREHDVAALIELDSLVDATKTARELREASRAMGVQRLCAFRETADSPTLQTLAQAIEDGAAQGHHTVIYGAGMAALPQRALLISWAFQSLSAACLSAPKLLRIGQSTVQRILAGSLADADARIAESLAVNPGEEGSFDPLVEIASMQHEVAHERLFIS